MRSRKQNFSQIINTFLFTESGIALIYVLKTSIVQCGIIISWSETHEMCTIYKHFLLMTNLVFTFWSMIWSTQAYLLGVFANARFMYVYCVHFFGAIHTLSPFTHLNIYTSLNSINFMKFISSTLQFSGRIQLNFSCFQNGSKFKIKSWMAVETQQQPPTPNTMNKRFFVLLHCVFMLWIANICFNCT